MTDLRHLAADNVREIVTDALRAEMGFGKPLSVAEVAVLIGVPERTVKSHHQGTNMPPVDTLLRYAAVLPARFTARVLAPAGLSGIVATEGAACSAPELMSHLAEEVAALANMLEDGRINHRERLELVNRLPRIREKLTHFEAAVRSGPVSVAAAE